MEKLFFWERGLKYIIRKRKRTVILFFVFLVICTLNLTMITIKDNILKMQKNISESAQTKVIADVKSTDDLIDIKEINFTQNIKIKQVNRISITYAFPGNFVNFKGKMEDDKREEMVTLYGYDDVALDSRFAEQEMKLLEGDMVTFDSEKAVMINNKLAEENQLKIGDEIDFTYEDKEVKGKVIGIYKSSVEDRQPETMVSFYRIENIIYASNDLISMLTGKQEYNKIVFYLENPDELSFVQKQIENDLGDKAAISISDTMFHKIKIQLEQINKITNIFWIGSIFLSVVIVTLLYCIWMHDRKKEIGILLSLGYRKWSVLAQILFESELLMFFSLLGGVFISYQITDKMIIFLNKVQDARISFDLSLSMNIVVKVLCVSLCLIVVSVLLSTIYLLVKKPREILAEIGDKQMKILIINVPYSGHVNPTISLTKEIVKRGHQVSYVNAEEFRKTIDVTGADFIPYANFPAEISEQEKKRTCFQAPYDTAMALTDSFDVLIYEMFFYPGIEIARKKKIPCVRQFLHNRCKEKSQWILLQLD